MSSHEGALPANFSVVDVLDEDAVATTYLVRGDAGREAVLTVARSAVEGEERAEHQRWASALTTAAASPNIADVIAVGLTGDGRPHLVCGTGEVLAERLHDDGALSLWTAQGFGVAIADALAAAHAEGITHGVVQPSTVLVLDGGAVLAGFGIMAPGLTVPGVVDAYTPPEHIAAVAVGRAEASQPGDVYGLGVTLYVALGGEPPWRDAPMDLALRSAPLPDLPSSTSELLDLVRAAVSVDQAARPTAEQLRDWLLGLDLLEADGAAGPIAPNLLTGRGARRVGRRTAALVMGAGGAIGVAGGVLGAGGSGTGAVVAAGTGTTGASTAATAGTASTAGTAATAGTAVTTGTAAVTAATAGGVAVSKVVIVTVVVAAVGVGGGIAGKRLYDDATCNLVVGDKPFVKVLTDGADLVNQAGHEFTLRMGERVNASGAVDPVAKEARFTMPPNGEGRLVGGVLYAGAGDKWRQVEAASDEGKLLAAAASSTETVKTALAKVATVNRNGCDFDGTLTADGGAAVPFKASIDNDKGRLVSFASNDIEARFNNFEVTVDVTAPSVPPRNLLGTWVKESSFYQLFIREGTVRVLWVARDGTMGDAGSGCTGQADTKGASIKVKLSCRPHFAEGGQATLTIEAVGDNRVSVTGDKVLAGTYNLMRR
ncbi:protein kinase domain-containing protein [Allokutzneria oryzae]|uniref:Protein kinase domain-containing protein n=1 Tax=Allokutzneria oryzae TaxID=1378989 RepID=A0ABV6A561_9PSEU